MGESNTVGILPVFAAPINSAKIVPDAAEALSYTTTELVADPGFKIKEVNRLGLEQIVAAVVTVTRPLEVLGSLIAILINLRFRIEGNYESRVF